jgi:copper chaperone CopZ
MRLFAILFCLALLGSACSSSGTKETGEADTDKVSISEENLTYLHLDVKGMTCEGCENAIVTSIKKLDGIQEASASHTDAEAMIVFDTTLTDVQAIAHAIENAGYTVEGQSARPQH